MLQLESLWTVPNVYWLLCLYGFSGPHFKKENYFYTPAFEVVTVSHCPGECLGFSSSSVWKLDACQLHRLVWAIPTGLLVKHQICQGCSNLFLGCFQVLVDNVVEFHTFVFGERSLGPFPHFKLMLASIQLNAHGQRCRLLNSLSIRHTEASCLDLSWGSKALCSACFVSFLSIGRRKGFWGGGSFWRLFLLKCCSMGSWCGIQDLLDISIIPLLLY